MRIKAAWGVIDVQHGRRKLAKRIQAGETFDILIHATVNEINSDDDGVSIEFGMDISKLEMK